jgi:hypothetical protein
MKPPMERGDRDIKISGYFTQRRSAQTSNLNDAVSKLLRVVIYYELILPWTLGAGLGLVDRRV